MAHVDDGKLNALLDGELNDAEAAAIRSHVATCADCGRRLDQAKRFLEAAADVLGEPEPAGPTAAQPRPSRTAKEVALDLDGDMGDTLDGFLARVMTPAADSQSR